MSLKLNYSLTPIGIVHAPYAARAQVPLEGTRAEIEIYPEYLAALEGMERSSHIYVIAFLHEADRSALKARPRKLDPQAAPLGVFACRSPARPNPLSLTLVRLLSCSGGRLVVEPLDLVDGTPVIDLKPYSPGWDDAFAARRIRRVPPTKLSDAQLRACLERALLGHLGEFASTDEARLTMAAVFVAMRHFALDARDPTLAATVNRSGIPLDALIGLLGASFASGRIRLMEDGAPLTFIFERAGARLRLEATAVSVNSLAEDPALWRERLFLA